MLTVVVTYMVLLVLTLVVCWAWKRVEHVREVHRLARRQQRRKAS